MIQVKNFQTKAAKERYLKDHVDEKTIESVFKRCPKILETVEIGHSRPKRHAHSLDKVTAPPQTKDEDP
jgi:hypothetical protein